MSQVGIRSVSGAREECVLMVDGAARGNPGEAGCGAVICEPDGRVVKELSRYLGRTTNNVAEYEGLLMGLEALLEMGKKQIIVQSDSELMVRQLNGEYRVKNDQLKKLFARAFHLLCQFERCRIVHVPRERNRLADRLANKGIEIALAKSSAG